MNNKKKYAQKRKKKYTTTDESEAIVYTPYTISNLDEFAPGYTAEAMKAGETGLCYVKCVDMYTVVHIPSNRVLILDWFVETEQSAQQWIEELVALADWRETVPRIRNTDCLNKLIGFGCIGLLTEGNLGFTSSTIR